MSDPRYDCQTCGACCVNPPENEAEGFRAWVEVAPGEPLLRRRDLVKKLCVIEADGPDRGAVHLRLDASGRCLALRGALGRRVACTIYARRPAPCRRVQAGAPDCRRYRAALGLANP